MSPIPKERFEQLVDRAKLEHPLPESDVTPSIMRSIRQLPAPFAKVQPETVVICGAAIAAALLAITIARGQAYYDAFLPLFESFGMLS